MQTNQKILNKKFKKEILRKLLHLSSLWIPLFIYFSNTYITIATLTFILVGNILIEYSNYKKQSVVRKYLGFFICKLSRSFELNRCKIRFSGSVFVLLASLLSVIIFTKEVAVLSISIMLIADTSAALFGKAYGKTKIFENKSFEGSMAFFLSSVITAFALDSIIHFNYTTLIACITATLFELYSKKLKLDDNLSITISVGAILTAF